jgi:hypothetical protein
MKSSFSLFNSWCEFGNGVILELYLKIQLLCSTYMTWRIGESHKADQLSEANDGSGAHKLAKGACIGESYARDTQQRATGIG